MMTTIMMMIADYFCLSNAEYKITCVSGLRSPVSGVQCPVQVGKTSNGHISATRYPIYFMFGSGVRFLARTD